MVDLCCWKPSPLYLTQVEVEKWLSTQGATFLNFTLASDLMLVSCLFPGLSIADLVFFVYNACQNQPKTEILK